MHDLHRSVLILQGEAQKGRSFPRDIPKEQPLGVILSVIESNQLELLDHS